MKKSLVLFGAAFLVVVGGFKIDQIFFMEKRLQNTHWEYESGYRLADFLHPGAFKIRNDTLFFWNGKIAFVKYQILNRLVIYDSSKENTGVYSLIDFNETRK